MKNTLLLIAAFVGLATSAFAQNVNQVNDAAKIVLPNGIATGEPPLASLARGVLSQDGSLVFRAVGDALVFEGATTDRFDTTFAITDPTANRTITFPDSSGTVLLTAIDQWVFEGATANAYETTVDAVDPTADGTIWLPDTGVGLADGNLSFVVSTINSGLNAPGLATSVWTGANSLVFEGATADAHEAVIDVADATADTIFRLPVAAAGTYSLFTSTLATNAPDIASSVTGASNSLVWEGSTADTSEIVLDAADAGADVIYRLPTAAAATYSVMSSTLATNAADIANSVTGASAALVFEGTADAFETSLTATDPTADRTVTMPNATGTVSLAQASTTTALTADDQAVTPGSNTRLQLTSDDGTATNRTFTLSATGAITGQIYVIIGPATNQCEIADTGIQVLSATWSPTTGDTLTLMFDGTNFNEIARSNN